MSDHGHSPGGGQREDAEDEQPVEAHPASQRAEAQPGHHGVPAPGTGQRNAQRSRQRNVGGRPRQAHKKPRYASRNAWSAVEKPRRRAVYDPNVVVKLKNEKDSRKRIWATRAARASAHARAGQRARLCAYNEQCAARGPGPADLPLKAQVGEKALCVRSAHGRQHARRKHNLSGRIGFRWQIREPNEHNERVEARGARRQQSHRRRAISRDGAGAKGTGHVAAMAGCEPPRLYMQHYAPQSVHRADAADGPQAKRGFSARVRRERARQAHRVPLRAHREAAVARGTDLLGLAAHARKSHDECAHQRALDAAADVSTGWPRPLHSLDTGN